MYPTFELFGRTFGLYPVMAIAGGLVSGAWACKTAKGRGYDDNNMIMLLLAAAAGAYIGGSLLYGATNWRYLWALLDNLDKLSGPGELLRLLSLIFGGAVFYGGLIGACLAGFIYMRVKKLDIPVWTDMLAPAAALFHAFGRVGCFLGGCCYGIECRLGLVFSRSPVEGANGVRRFPVQLAEALFELALCFILSRLDKKGRLRGRLFALYLTVYSLGRFALEFLRGDEARGFIFGLSTSQAIGALVFAAGLAWLLIGGAGAKRRNA